MFHFNLNGIKPTSQNQQKSGEMHNGLFPFLIKHQAKLIEKHPLITKVVVKNDLIVTELAADNTLNMNGKPLFEHHITTLPHFCKTSSQQNMWEGNALLHYTMVVTNEVEKETYRIYFHPSCGVIKITLSINDQPATLVDRVTNARIMVIAQKYLTLMHQLLIEKEQTWQQLNRHIIQLEHQTSQKDFCQNIPPYLEALESYIENLSEAYNYINHEHKDHTDSRIEHLKKIITLHSVETENPKKQHTHIKLTLNEENVEPSNTVTLQPIKTNSVITAKNKATKSSPREKINKIIDDILADHIFGQLNEKKLSSALKELIKLEAAAPDLTYSSLKTLVAKFYLNFSDLCLEVMTTQASIDFSDNLLEITKKYLAFLEIDKTIDLVRKIKVIPRFNEAFSELIFSSFKSKTLSEQDIMNLHSKLKNAFDFSHLYFIVIKSLATDETLPEDMMDQMTNLAKNFHESSELYRSCLITRGSEYREPFATPQAVPDEEFEFGLLACAMVHDRFDVFKLLIEQGLPIASSQINRKGVDFSIDIRHFCRLQKTYKINFRWRNSLALKTDSTQYWVYFVNNHSPQLYRDVVYLNSAITTAVNLNITIAEAQRRVEMHWAAPLAIFSCRLMDASLSLSPRQARMLDIAVLAFIASLLILTLAILTNKNLMSPLLASGFWKNIDLSNEPTPNKCPAP